MSTGQIGAPRTPYHSTPGILPGDTSQTPTPATDPTGGSGSTPIPSVPDDSEDPGVPRSRTLATIDSMGRSSGAAFADSAYFTGLFDRGDSPQNNGVKPDWETIGLAGGTVAGVGGLYRLASKLDTVTSAKQSGAVAAEGAARAIGGLGKLAIFATPVIAAGVAAPALADLANLAAPNLVKQHRDRSEAATTTERHRIDDNNTESTIGRTIAGAGLVGALTFAGMMLHQKPLPGQLGTLLGGGVGAALKGAGSLGVVGGVSAGAFYNVFNKDGDICNTHSPLRSY